MSHLPLAGRVAVVSGANHGIGAATAVELARLGADVALTYLALTLDDHEDPHRSADYRTQREQGPDATIAAVEAHGVRCTAHQADLSDPDEPARVFATAEANLGVPTILVNNASGWRKDSFDPGGSNEVGWASSAMTAATIDAQLLVDARGGALMMAELARRVRAAGVGWGRIISLTSGGPGGFPGQVSYGAAKAALENYTMAASIELADDGITANVVYPPVTDTGWVTDAVRELVAQSPDHVHVSAPAEVAEVIGWLCTDAARLVTGNVLRLR